MLKKWVFCEYQGCIWWQNYIFTPVRLWFMTLHPPSLLHILSGGYTLSSYNPPSQKKPGVTCLRLYCPLLSQLGMCRAYRSSRGPRLSLKGILDILSRIWSSSCWHWVLKKEQKQQQRSRTGGPYGDIWVCSSHQVGKLSCSYSNFCKYKKNKTIIPPFTCIFLF